MMSHMIGHLDPDFMLIMDEVSELLKRVFQTEEHTTLALSGTVRRAWKPASIASWSPMTPW